MANNNVDNTVELPVMNSFKAACSELLKKTKQMCAGGKNKAPQWFGDWTKHLETFLTDATVMVESLEKANVNMDSKISVQSTVTDRLVDEVHELRQYGRRTNLLIHGVEEEEYRPNEKVKEDTDAKVTEIFHARLGLENDFDPKDISRSHRLGKRKNGKKRPIIVRFTSYRARKTVFDAKKKLKGSGVSITENLTKERYDLYKKCGDLFGKENCWTLDGRINCLLTELDRNGRRKLLVVTKESDLVEQADLVEQV